MTHAKQEINLFQIKNTKTPLLPDVGTWLLVDILEKPTYPYYANILQINIMPEKIAISIECKAVFWRYLLYAAAVIPYTLLQDATMQTLQDTANMEMGNQIQRLSEPTKTYELQMFNEIIIYNKQNEKITIDHNSIK